MDHAITTPAVRVQNTDGSFVDRPPTKHGSAAVKVLNDSKERSERDVNDFKFEMQLLKNFSHPNVLALLALCEITRPLMLITEFGDTNLEKVSRQIDTNPRYLAESHRHAREAHFALFLVIADSPGTFALMDSPMNSKIRFSSGR